MWHTLALLLFFWLEFAWLRAHTHNEFNVPNVLIISLSGNLTSIVEMPNAKLEHSAFKKPQFVVTLHIMNVHVVSWLVMMHSNVSIMKSLKITGIGLRTSRESLVRKLSDVDVDSITYLVGTSSTPKIRNTMTTFKEELKWIFLVLKTLFFTMLGKGGRLFMYRKAWRNHKVQKAKLQQSLKLNLSLKKSITWRKMSSKLSFNRS